MRYRIRNFKGIYSSKKLTLLIFLGGTFEILKTILFIFITHKIIINIVIKLDFGIINIFKKYL